MSQEKRPTAPGLLPDIRARGEILFPHDPAAGPVTAVKNVVMQSSLAQLKANGHFERYAKIVPREVLEELTSSLGPGWIPVDLVLAHYEACDKLELEDRELRASGAAVGERLQETTLVSAAKKGRPKDFDPWTAVAQLHRMWPRLYRGGSVQLTKLGPRSMLTELSGFPMNRFAYHRKAQLAALKATYAAVGLNISVSVLSYDADTGEIVYQITWD